VRASGPRCGATSPCALPVHVSFFAQALVSVFAVVDPVAAAALFAAITSHNSEVDRHVMAARAAATTGIVLSVFLFFGGALFVLLSITMTAFRLAGGLVIGIMALDLLKATHTGVRSTAEEESEGLAKEDVSVTPIAVPMLAGPGAISTVMILAARTDGPATYLTLLVVIVLVSLCAWILLRQAARVTAVLGQTGINVLGRLMGLIVLAIAVQFMVDALLQLMPAFYEALHGVRGELL
jgi:multiple antibiotic resistance protein